MIFPCRCSRRQDMSFLPEMFVPVLVLVVAPTQRPNPTEARPGHRDQSPRLRRPLAGRSDLARPPTHEPISDFGQGLPPGAMGLHRSTRPPWPTMHSNHKQYQERGPLERPRTCLHRRPRVSAPVCHATSTTAVRRGFGWFCQGVGHGLTFGATAPASASQHITSAGTRPSASPRRPAPAPPHRPESP
jgi:hypothetical protein